MALPKCTVLAVAFMGVSAICHAQQKFPQRSGDWEVSTTFPGATKPLTLHICLNDELWTKALSASGSCSMQNLSVFSKGVSYQVDCPAAKTPMKGRVELTFDGKEHMSGKATFDSIANGATNNSIMIVDYRWKGVSCNADDANVKKPAAPPSPQH